MGIEQFFSSIEKNEIANLISNFTTQHNAQINTKYLFIDFNSIVHITSAFIVSKLNNMLFNIIYNKKITDTDYYSKYGIKIKNIKGSQFKKHITLDVIDKMIIDETLNNVIYILQDLINPIELSLLYIAIDGVPSKSKIIEQRNRRFMGYIMAELKNDIFKKHKANLIKDKQRYEYEQLKFDWSKNKISPGTPFMHTLYTELVFDNFKSKLRIICPNLKTYICSGPYNPGEGEKKIVDFLRMNKYESSSYVIYSPDSDVTLLSLLLNNDKSDYDNSKIKTLKILRHNQQQNIYNVIDIDKLSHNIYTYINSKVKHHTKKNNIIDDIVFLMSIFGNDFIPKIESMNVRNDITFLIDTYIYILNKAKRYIVIMKSDKVTKDIDINMLLLLLDKLCIYQDKRLVDNYLSNNYRNYKELKRIFCCDDFINSVQKFLNIVKLFNNDIKTMPLNYVINKWNKNTDFMNKIIKFSKHSNDISNEEFIANYFNVYKQKHKFPQLVILNSYKKSLDEYFHKTNFDTMIKKKENMIPTNYDRDMYRFNFMLDDYKEKFNANSLNLGKIYIDDTYTWKIYNINESIREYYQKFFKVTNNNDMKKVLHEYYFGLLWVFDYYFNNFDPNKYSSVWNYKYNKAPLLKDLFNYIRNNKHIKKEINNNISKSFINNDQYFNALEHLMYVSPKEVLLELLPSELHSFIKTSKYYVDTNLIVNDIRKHNKIDCTGVLYLNKCHLSTKFMLRIDDGDFIKKIRKISKNNEINKLSGKNVTATIDITHFNKVIQIKDIK